VSRAPAVTIVGAGAAARSLAAALHRAGVTIAGVYSANGRSARALAGTVKAPLSGTLTTASQFSPFVILAVPDDVIEQAAGTVAAALRNARSTIVVHLSGAQTSTLLRPIKRKGAAVASMHPLMTFPARRASVPLNGAWFALEGDRTAVSMCRRILDRIGATSFTISRKGKSFYHLAAVFASNYPVTLLGVVEQLAVEAGVPRKDVWKIFRPLVLAAVNNVLATSPAAALTGPIVRGDHRTVLRHLEALASSERMNHLTPLYAALGVETAALAQRKR
jgi:predicted short-subunit dehydrogenase-like oxidoreductase (DUF2520 family)